MKAELRLNDRCYNRSKKRSDVDAHVEQIVSAVLQMASVGIEVSDHSRDIRFEEAVPDHQTGQSCIYKRERTYRQQQMPRHEEEAADHHCSAIAEFLVGDPSTDQRATVDEHHVVRVEGRGLRGGPRKAFVRIAQVKSEHRHHRVETEALPHLGGEQNVESLRMLFQIAPCLDVFCDCCDSHRPVPPQKPDRWNSECWKLR